MIGAIVGDIVGSVYEFKNAKNKNFEFFSKGSKFTDDTVMTCAIAKSVISYLDDKDLKNFENNCIFNMRKLGTKYINAGYGGRFINWLLSKEPKPYNSYGNGSAMRVSTVAFAANTLEEIEQLAEISARVTHNHIYGIKGAKVVAGSIFLARNHYDKKQIYEYAKQYFDIDFSLDEIRKDYHYDVTCQGSVPQAIVSFLEASNFEDAIKNAISIGGDSDTIAAITGSISEAYYGVPKSFEVIAKEYLTPELDDIVNAFYEKTEKLNINYEPNPLTLLR